MEFDGRRDCVGGPGGLDPYAIAQGWNTVDGVRRLLRAKTESEIRESGLRHAIDYLTNTSTGIIAEVKYLREENASLLSTLLNIRRIRS